MTKSPMLAMMLAMSFMTYMEVLNFLLWQGWKPNLMYDIMLCTLKQMINTLIWCVGPQMENDVTNENYQCLHFQ